MWGVPKYPDPNEMRMWKKERKKLARTKARAIANGGWLGADSDDASRRGVRGLSGPFHARVRTEQQQIQPQQIPGQAQQQIDRSIKGLAGHDGRPAPACCCSRGSRRRSRHNAKKQTKANQQPTNSLVPICVDFFFACLLFDRLIVRFFLHP